jgi:hypothetical protein
MMAAPDAAVLEVPTIRTGSRTQWIALVFWPLDLLILSRHLSWPLLVPILALMVTGIAAAVFFMRRTAKRRPAVRVTPAHLRLPVGEESTVEVDWSDIARFSIGRRRWPPYLEVEPVDPDRVRPAPNRWELAAGTRGDRYRLRVELGGDRAIRARLQAELAARIPGGQERSGSGALR